jgi:hypothetical protein
MKSTRSVTGYLPANPLRGAPPVEASGATPEPQRPAAGHPWPRDSAADNGRFRKTLGIFQAQMGELPPPRKGSIAAD